MLLKVPYRLDRLPAKVGRLPKLLSRQHRTICLILSHEVFSKGVYEVVTHASQQSWCTTLPHASRASATRPWTTDGASAHASLLHAQALRRMQRLSLSHQRPYR